MSDTVNLHTEEINPNTKDGILTIFTDTSWCPETKAAGWAAWMRTTNHKYLVGGTYDRQIMDSTEGELFAIVNALIEARNNKMLKRATFVVIVTDSLCCQHLLQGSRKCERTWEHQGVNAAKRIIEMHGIKFKVNKVKAHNGVSTPRNWVNDRVDKLAKSHMRNMRRKLETQLEPYTGDTPPWE